MALQGPDGVEITKLEALGGVGATKVAEPPQPTPYDQMRKLTPAPPDQMDVMLAHGPRRRRPAPPEPAPERAPPALKVVIVGNNHARYFDGEIVTVTHNMALARDTRDLIYYGTAEAMVARGEAKWQGGGEVPVPEWVRNGVDAARRQGEEREQDVDRLRTNAIRLPGGRGHWVGPRRGESFEDHAVRLREERAAAAAVVEPPPRTVPDVTPVDATGTAPLLRTLRHGLAQVMATPGLSPEDADIIADAMRVLTDLGKPGRS